MKKMKRLVKRIPNEIYNLIKLAQSKHYTRDAFLSRIKRAWGKTEQGKKDLARDVAHQKWMNQIIGQQRETDMKKPYKRLPRYIDAACDSIGEEIWQIVRDDAGDGGLTEKELKWLKDYVLKLLNSKLG